MKKLITRDKEDYELFTITISSSNDFEIFEAISDTYTELMNNSSDAIIASEEITLTAETKLELLSEFIEYLISTQEDDMLPAICQCLMGTSSNTYSLYVTIHYLELFTEAEAMLESVIFYEDEEPQIVEVKLRVQTPCQWD